jgi:hypothetical protein
MPDPITRMAKERLTELFGAPAPSAAAGFLIWRVPGNPTSHCRIFLYAHADLGLTHGCVDTGGPRPKFERLLSSKTDVDDLIARALAEAQGEDPADG